MEFLVEYVRRLEIVLMVGLVGWLDVINQRNFYMLLVVVCTGFPGGVGLLSWGLVLEEGRD